MSDVYVVVHIATTCDETNIYITKDSTETIELAWSFVDASSLDIIFSQTVLVRPINTLITPYCTQHHRISWEHVKSAGTFKDAIWQFDKSVQDNIISQNKEFTFVTIDVSSLRVQIPREARDKGVVLPPYLQHPRIFDLQVEYSKWQSTHPEALSYTSSSLSNIITALEVEVEEGELSPASVTSSSASTPPPQAQSGAKLSFPPTPTNVTETGVDESYSRSTINLHSKMLVQLVKKSLPLEDHLTVLTKPYDSSQDVKCFLSERSKILYLSNLPSDTTQSELESWFTQYGARPIAFWTLKNFESLTNNNGLSKSSKGKGTSGFCVFSTHEEAAEALGLSGKALNERAVEVQPSSTKVLDKASDLLTPFPPSKNRPRPGDWTCPSCGFSNFQRRTACFRCSFPATSAVAIQESIHPNNTMGRRLNGGSGSSVYGSSPNSSTDKLSLNAAVINAIHTSNQHYNNAAQYVSYNQDMNHSMQGHGHNHNHMHNQNRGYYGNSVPFRAGDWKCTNESCQYHNFAKNLCCLKCGMNKPPNLGNNANQMNQQNQNPHLHSMNATAATIAAATATGQSLNLNTSFLGSLQQPQPHHSSQAQAPIQQRQQNANNYINSLQHMQYSQTSGANSRNNSNNTQQQSQMLNQQYTMMSHSLSTATGGSGQSQASHSTPLSSTRQNFSPSSTSSPGLYPVFGMSQYKQPSQGGINQLETPNTLANGNQSINNFNSLASQLNSLNLNP